MLKIEAYPLGYCKESEYTRVVCVSEYKGKFVFSYNKKRKGWEIPGGHVEEGETWEEAAQREMYEETGATKIEIEPVCVYKINSFALLCFCEIIEMEEISKEYEMEKVMLCDNLPQNLTFPEAHTLYFDIVKRYIEQVGDTEKVSVIRDGVTIPFDELEVAADEE